MLESYYMQRWVIGGTEEGCFNASHERVTKDIKEKKSELRLKIEIDSSDDELDISSHSYLEQSVHESEINESGSDQELSGEEIELQMDSQEEIRYLREQMEFKDRRIAWRDREIQDFLKDSFIRTLAEYESSQKIISLKEQLSQTQEQLRLQQARNKEQLSQVQEQLRLQQAHNNERVPYSTLWQEQARIRQQQEGLRHSSESELQQDQGVLTKKRCSIL